MSGWPAVVSIAVRAVLFVRIALVERVVAWMNMSTMPKNRARVIAWAAAARSTASRMPTTGSAGVVGALNRWNTPSADSTTRSVNVPPTSAETRIRKPFLSWDEGSPSGRRGRDHRPRLAECGHGGPSRRCSCGLFGQDLGRPGEAQVEIVFLQQGVVG